MKLLHLALAIVTFSPITEKLATQPGAGWGEMVARQVDQLAGIVWPCLQGGDQILALIQLIVAKTNHEIVVL